MKANIKNRLSEIIPKSSIVKMLIALLLSVGLMITAIEIITNSALTRLSEQTDNIARMRNRSVSISISTALANSEWVGDSFLANICNISYPDKDSVIVHAYHSITEEQLKELTAKKLYTLLRRFMETNYDLFSASFIFKPGVIADAPQRGIAANVRSEELSARDLLDECDIFSKNIFLNGESSRLTYISNAQTVSEDDEDISTIVFPIFDSEGNLLGEFWMDIRLGNMSTTITRALYSDEMNAIILDKDIRIVTSNKPKWNARDFLEVMEEITGESYSVEDIREFEQLVRSRKTLTYYYTLGEREYRVILSPLHGYDYSLLLTTRAEFHSREIRSFKRRMMTVGLAGILLILGCLIYAFTAFKKKVKENSIMNHDLAIASGIQRNFLPRANFKKGHVDFAAFQRPARIVGGDLFDYIERDDKLFFCIGDVSGKGVPASIFMGLASSHFRNACRKINKVEYIASSVNDSLADRNESSVFCTMFIGILDMKTLELSYCNAGHESPALLDITGKVQFVSTVSDIPLGIEPGYRFNAGTLSFTKGQRLFFFTDGISEARAANGSLFRKEHILQALSEISAGSTSIQVNKQMIAKVDNFAKGADQSDDITMVTISFL